jgi:hypothetical protein
MKAIPTLLCSLVCFVFATKLCAGPANDLFANRTLLTRTNVTVSGTNSGAGTEPGEDTGTGAVLWSYSVWYEWTAPTNGVVHLSGSTTVWGFCMSTRVYRGSEVNALTLAATTPDGGVPVNAGDTIAIQVASIYYPGWGGCGGTGPFTLTLSLEVPAPTSANDAFANRLEITTPTYHFDGGIYGATSEPGEPLPPGASQTLWWKFIAPEEGMLTLWLSAPQFTPVMTLYEGASFGSVTSVTPLNGLRYRLQARHEYSLQMAIGYIPGGAFALDARFFSMTNDSFAASTHLEGKNITYVGNLTTATFEPNEPNPGATNTIWVSWAAPFTGRARFSRVTTPYFQYVALYTGPTLDRLQRVRTVDMDNGRFDFLVVEGTVYHFQLAGGADECTLMLQLNSWGPATNDFFAGARCMVGNYVNPRPDQEWFPVTDATAELGEPAHLGGIPFKSLWWRWSAPVHGNSGFWAERSLATNVVLAAYTGSAVEALTQIAKGANKVTFAVNGGDTYYIAAAVPTNAVGDVLVYGGMSSQSTTTRAVPGNLLREPSWEGTSILGAEYWKMSGSIGGYVGENGGADGTTWPALGGGARIWQDFPTVPGRNHAIRFAFQFGHDLSASTRSVQIRVSWDDRVLGVAQIANDEGGYWHWSEFTACASNITSRLTLENLGGMFDNVEVDAFSVVPLNASPTIATIVTQPMSVSTFAGAAASFIVGATGTAPLGYQWFFKDEPLPGQKGNTLSLSQVSASDAGEYQVIITNTFGAATSAPVTLVVEAPTSPTIVLQPYGDTVAVGASYVFTVAAVGTPPLSYQWFFNGGLLAGATNRQYTLPSVQTISAGAYAVKVWNAGETVWSLPARLVVDTNLVGGGAFWFGNVIPDGGFMRQARVFDVEGITKLNGAAFSAQLYAGPSLALIRPVGEPRPFLTGFNAGLIDPVAVVLPTVSPLMNAFVQVRVWESSRGASYEEARALGGRFGRSAILQITPGIMPDPPPLWGLQSFNLQAGLPQFATGMIRFVETQLGGIVVWEHQGEPGFRYVIEKSVHGFEWRPYLVITNTTSTVTFTDSANSGSAVGFYRSRILD